MAEKREEGYYWFRTGTVWEIALFEDEKWHFINDEWAYPFTPEYMHEILDTPIKPPQNN